MKTIEECVALAKFPIVDGAWSPDVAFLNRLEEYLKEEGSLDNFDPQSRPLQKTMKEMAQEIEEGLHHEKMAAFLRTQYPQELKYGDFTVNDFIAFIREGGFVKEAEYIKQHFSFQQRVFDGPFTFRDSLQSMREGTPFGIMSYALLYSGGMGWFYIQKKE